MNTLTLKASAAQTQEKRHAVQNALLPVMESPGICCPRIMNAKDRPLSFCKWAFVM